jgi:hypothetical protein
MRLKNESATLANSPRPRRFYGAALWSLWALGVALQIVGFTYKPGFSLRYWSALRLASLRGSARL